MRFPAKIVAWVLPLFLSGCWFHRNPKDTSAFSPLLRRLRKPLLPTLRRCLRRIHRPEVTIPNQTSPGATTAKTKPPIKRPSQRQNIKSDLTAPPANKETQQAAAAQPEVNAIGQLSSRRPGRLNASDRNIPHMKLKRGLNGINRQLDEQEQTTAAHITEYLKQAREAAQASGDVDGAQHAGPRKRGCCCGEITNKHRFG